MSQWGQPVNGDYLAVQVNGMLAQLKYKPVKDDSPWIDLNLSGDTNAKAAAEILDWFTAHNFYDCGRVMAAAVGAAIPILIIFIFLQKYMIAGLTAGAVKE